MFVGLPAFVAFSQGTPPPPYGTLLSSHCGGYSAQDAGVETYYDEVGTPFEGMFTLWEQLADGAGGYFWSSPGNNASDELTNCYYPYGFCVDANTSDNFVAWDSCGSSGNFGPWSYSYDYTYSDGFGGTYNSSGGGAYTPPYSGDIIYQSGVDNCCTVYYDGAGGYYVSDSCGGGCPEYGTYLSDGCNSTDGYDASGAFFSGTWTFGSFYADGECGQYFVEAGTDMNGCYHPDGWKFDYTSYNDSVHWTVTDSEANTQAEGDFTYSSGWSSSNIADGAGGTYPGGSSWSANYGDLIASGTYYDNGLAYDVYYEVFADGMGGYWVGQNPA